MSESGDKKKSLIIKTLKKAEKAELEIVIFEMDDSNQMGHRVIDISDILPFPKDSFLIEEST